MHRYFSKSCFKKKTPRVCAEFGLDKEIFRAGRGIAVIALGQAVAIAGETSNYDRNREAEAPSGS